MVWMVPILSRPVPIAASSALFFSLPSSQGYRILAFVPVAHAKKTLP